MSEAQHPLTAGSYPADGFGRIDDLACQRGLVPVFQGLAAELKAGQTLALYGANGSGKTSLLRIMAGLLPPMAGTIQPAPKPEDAHYLGHMDGLKPALSVSETLSMMGGFYNAAPFDPTALLAALGLAGREAQRVGDLSAGQRRRLGLARLVIAPRPLWLLDEPLTALDEAGRALIAAMAGAHMAAHGLILAASHETLPFATNALWLSTEGAR